MRLITRLLCEEEAATAVEYAVMLALILMAALGAVTTVGSETADLWGGNDAKLLQIVWPSRN